ncbi:ubiquitin-conjugating enzyme E2 [Stereum hirsutum FP-91666 SS1]|uniref:ubiquitin-conjugating enzyme E2 n=1 Tax=Stereum hirsutum (strain FP-91666) TaxID=721885 RepID=UPI000444A686|nr:ubiquitin-conjugating enzyme E2 [Stereum hirsutum FP-91666 SS1]EIM82566.1 ubiquitin-conjugating enzyme E2 [Stereum hirsutum FP-91666 SS1]
MDQLTTSLAPARASPSAKNAASGPGKEGAGSVTKRLSNELMTLMMSASPGISAFPKSDSNLYEWVGTLEGAPATIYADLVFRISINFPPNYPYVPPQIKFDTPCFHPNVDLNSGAICLDILQDKWSAIYSVQTILISLQSLLGEPNNASPLNPDASQLWANPTAFKQQLMKNYRPLSDDPSA